MVQKTVIEGKRFLKVSRVAPRRRVWLALGDSH